ncbi:glycoside hydrolase superfamily [Chiua virens]|nr:glycoside hydrolase superfamily [Chiua virens]
MSTSIEPPFPRAWWKSAVVYQIYPSSFFDSNGDGIGDLNGIHAKLDYLKDLGVDVIWLSPIYRSPQADMGYDISDYRDIDPRYGTLADWDNLLQGVHERGMKLMMDLVANHTSDEHEWFQQSKSSKNDPKRDWYMWRPPKYVDGQRFPPNNWKSVFQGSAWELDPITQEYYLHLYVQKQPDLNWDNPIVRNAVWDVMRFWIERGCDGFRMDVINIISKVQGLPDAPVVDHSQYHQPASMYFANGPHVHEYIKEMHREVLSHHDLITVGETPFTHDASVLAEYVLPKNKELNTVFNFDLMDLDSPEESPLVKKAWRLTEFKAIVGRWQMYKREEGYWNAVFIENHDHARAVSRFGNDSVAWRAISAKMLAVLEVTQTGTLYMYQGQELGMKNFPRTWGIEEYKDVASQNYWALIKGQRQEATGKDEVDMEGVLDGFQQKARDHARIPMQASFHSPLGGVMCHLVPMLPAFFVPRLCSTSWSLTFSADPRVSERHDISTRHPFTIHDVLTPCPRCSLPFVFECPDERSHSGTATPNAGFTAGTPWMRAFEEDAREGWNAADQSNAPASVLAFWKRALQVRRVHDVLIYGDFEMRLDKDERVFAYVRTLGDVRAWILLNFSDGVVEVEREGLGMDEDDARRCQLVLGNYEDHDDGSGLSLETKLALRGYEARVYVINRALMAALEWTSKSPSEIQFPPVTDSLCHLIADENLRGGVVNRFHDGTETAQTRILDVKVPTHLMASLKMIARLAEHHSDLCERFKPRLYELAKRKGDSFGSAAVNALVAMSAPFTRDIYICNTLGYLSIILPPLDVEVDSSLSHDDTDEFRLPTVRWVNDTGILNQEFMLQLVSTITSRNVHERTQATLTLLKLCRDAMVREFCTQKNVLDIFVSQLKQKKTSLLAAYALRKCLEYDMCTSDHSLHVAPALVSMVNKN